jgi:hypothetical protein
MKKHLNHLLKQSISISFPIPAGDSESIQNCQSILGVPSKHDCHYFSTSADLIFNKYVSDEEKKE